MQSLPSTKQVQVRRKNYSVRLQADGYQSFKSAMSAILVDTNNKKVLEETWISSIFKEYEAFPQIVSKKRQEEEMDYERDC